MKTVHSSGSVVKPAPYIAPNHHDRDTKKLMGWRTKGLKTKQPGQQMNEMSRWMTHRPGRHIESYDWSSVSILGLNYASAPFYF